MAHDREVAGIRCTQVLEVLSDYVDDDLSAEERARVEAHLRGCDWCASFGGAFAEVVTAIQASLGDEAPPSPEVRARLRARLGLVED